MKYKYTDTVIVIPARFNSTRLPGKSLADINGLPMVVRVMNIAKQLGLCETIVATENQQVVETIQKYNGVAVLTDDNLQSGTDRVYQALKKTNNEYKYIVNLQGDMPNIDGEIIEQITDLLHQHNNADVMTAVYKIKDLSWREKPQCVKAVLSYNESQNYHKCLYFSRSNVPNGNGDAYAHLGIYGYTKSSLERFVALPTSRLEKSEKLEQLRALENNMSVYATIVDSFPISVDVDEDLKLARKFIK